MVAVKEIRPGDNEGRQKVTTHWESEIKALERMNELNQDHIVRFIAAFQLCKNDRKDHYLMFEWADGGNLKTLWEEVHHPSLSPSLVQASIKQLFGLAEALSRAHYLPNNASYRHGDLKPANILRFVDGSIVGTLKIGDWGEAKEHNNVTEFRFNKTTAAFATRRYQAPEAETGVNPKFLHQSPKRRTRLYDIWAMGCITLEFMVWLLYGWHGLDKFCKEFVDNSPFYEIYEDAGERKAKVHGAANRWMDHMAKEPICQLDRALGRLLEAVRKGLLVVKLPRRTGSNLAMGSLVSDMSQPPSPPVTRDENGTSTSMKSPSDLGSNQSPVSDLPTIKFTAAEPTMIPVEAKSESSGPVRLLATELKDRLEEILGEEDNDENYWFIDTPRSIPPPDPNRPTYAPRHGGDYTEGTLQKTATLRAANRIQPAPRGLNIPEVDEVRRSL